MRGLVRRGLSPRGRADSQRATSSSRPRCRLCLRRRQRRRGPQSRTIPRASTCPPTHGWNAGFRTDPSFAEPPASSATAAWESRKGRWRRACPFASCRSGETSSRSRAGSAPQSRRRTSGSARSTDYACRGHAGPVAAEPGAGRPIVETGWESKPLSSDLSCLACPSAVWTRSSDDRARAIPSPVRVLRHE